MQQKAVRDAAAIAAARQLILSTDVESAALAKLKEAGMQFDPLSRETRASLRRATAGVIDDVRKWVGADLVDKVLAASRSAKAREPVAASVPAAAPLRAPADGGGRR
jgi:TRAP-type transport system periplasmic protein